MVLDILHRIDKKGRILVVYKIAVELFRTCMACGLCIFIPQTCFDENRQESVLCTIQCNVNYLCVTEVKLCAISFNCFTVLCFSLLYFIEIKRDEWLMKHFELDTDKADSNLDFFRTKYRPLFKKLNNYNNMYYMCYKSICVIYVCNVAISSVVLYNSYYDLTTITVFLTNISLCSNKIYNGILVSKASLEKIFPCATTPEYFCRLIKSTKTTLRATKVDPSRVYTESYFSAPNCRILYQNCQ